ncbi:PAAR domain-containing protein [Paraburkholderia edwinii]|uniref:PAAR domain-containing protein n=1 Tax=Paraburkholderia edwinii TaxID=2861782 RepID=A0ABX8UI27_9BURK|nr:PAAR domain-containing protein [Paraburkholderia edwinii]QYD68564.1 PAAR domain-containing protein [Paraburkholderia edwinii]
MPDQQEKEATYFFATIGARTELGGRVTKATTHIECDGLAFARVGDIVTYEDGSEASIVDGAGSAAISDDKPIALVGSSLSNGDKITQTLQNGCCITVRVGEEIPGLFDATYEYVPVAATPDRGRYDA